MLDLARAMVATAASAVVGGYVWVDDPPRPMVGSIATGSRWGGPHRHEREATRRRRQMARAAA